MVAEGGGLDPRSTYGRSLLARCLDHARARGVVGPRVLILGAVKPDVDDPRAEVFLELGAAFVENLMAGDKGEGHAEAAAAIDRADVVFIRGGDQSRYVKFWMRSPVREALRRVPGRGGVVIGSSAGCAVLSEWVYDALRGSLGGLDSLRDARAPELTLTRPFLGYAKGVLFDTHFVERGRLPRLACMLGVLARPVVGVGIEASTSVVVSGEADDQIGEVVGEGVVTLLRGGEGWASLMPVGRPPAVLGLRMDVLAPGTRFRLRDGAVQSRPAWAAKSDHGEGQPEETSFAACLVRGEAPEDAKAGLRYVMVEKDKPVLRDGQGKVPWLVLPGLWTQLPRAGAWMLMLRAMVEQPGAAMLVLDEGTNLDFGEDGGVRVSAAGESRAGSAVVVTSRGATYAGTHGEHVYLEGLRLDVLPPGWAADLKHGGIEPSEGVTPEPVSDVGKHAEPDDDGDDDKDDETPRATK